MTEQQLHKEEMNHQAYMDCLDIKGPSIPSDEVYMECYRFWYAVDPKRFDPYPTEH